MKIGKEGCVSVFRGQRRKEKKGKEDCERRTAATGAGHALTIGWSNAAPARRRHVSPASWAEPRREPSRPDRPTRDYAEAGARGRRACSLRLAPSRARGHALPACCWCMSTRGTANLAQLLYVCPIFVPVPVLILFLRE